MGEHNCYRTDEAECIRKKAYELWEKDGRKPGRDLHYWLDAEKNVRTSLRKDSQNGRNINKSRGEVVKSCCGQDMEKK